jgi:hypothetical protein
MPRMSRDRSVAQGIATNQTTRFAMYLAPALTITTMAALMLFMPVSAAAGSAKEAHSDPELINPTRHLIQGQRVMGRCLFASTLTLAPGERVVAQNELARDDVTCIMLVERGTPRSSATGAEPGTTSEEEEQTPKQSIGTPPICDSGCDWHHSAGYMKAVYHDPPHFQVNSVRNHIDWYWNNAQVSSATCTATWEWLTDSGWQRPGWDSGCAYRSNQTSIEGSGYAHYKNPYFCGTVDTHVYYDRNYVHGGSTNWLSGQVFAWTGGGCESFLHRHEWLERTS